MSNLAKFIEEEVKKRKLDYLSSPSYILEHYNIERQNIQAYNGRQLLEMLQNADDASENADEKKVLIELKDNVLTIANNGEPFNEDGFRSIIYSNISPKTLQQNKIGQKGLGFRSILSWADEVIIDSGGTRLSFSEINAKVFLENLINEFPEVSEFIQQNSSSKFPIAILRVPQVLTLENGSFRSFETIISIKLKAEIIDEVQQQINSIINKETLIFLNNIETIEIDSPQRKIIFKKSYSDKTKTKITIDSTNDNDCLFEFKTWNIKRKYGNHKEKNYELAIAWNDNLDDKENTLYSFFKTEVRFPFPALLHGTFELTQDRNQLVNDTEGHNEYLTGILADLLIETALEIASQNEIVNFLPLTLLNIEFDKIDNIFNKFKFKDIVIAKIKSSNIFPTVNNTYISYKEQPVYYDLPVAKILDGNDVNNLMPICTNECVIEFLKSFSIYHYSLKKYISIIAKRVNQINISELAKLFYLILVYDPYKKQLNSEDFNLFEFEPFLLDGNNKIINWDSNIFIYPQDSKEFQIPQYLNIRFLNQEFINNLLNEFKFDNLEFLINRLEIFSIKKYSFYEVALTLIRHFILKENLDKNDVIELHAYLFQLFKKEIDNNSNLSTVNISVPVIVGNNKLGKAPEVYFGKAYGNLIIEQLFNYDTSKLLADQYFFRLENENQVYVKKYFNWLGVVDLPRKINTIAPFEFADYVFKKFDFKNKKIDDYHFSNYEKFKSKWNRYGSILVQSISD